MLAIEGQELHTCPFSFQVYYEIIKIYFKEINQICLFNSNSFLS